MSGYLPLDLSELANAGLSVLLRPESAAAGAQSMRGLPFLVGSDPNRCLLAFGNGVRNEAMTVPVEQTACTVVVAHALLESAIAQGGPVGETVADYVFRLADGSEHTVAIRERFQIAVVPTAWGQLAFDAVPDRYDSRPARYVGPWGDAGERQTEAEQAWPQHYYLWAWQNPRPGLALTSLTIRPRGPRFVIGGITLSQLAESPFARQGGRTVKISLAEPALAQRAFDLAVEVDRGVATFPYPLPPDQPDQFLADPLAGFGEPLNRTSSPAYVEIAAIPSATVTVKHGSDVLGAVSWQTLEAAQRAEAGPVRLEIVEEGRNWVRTTVVDDATGRPIPCRVHFRSPSGVPYQPHGHHRHVNSNLNTWHVDVGGDLRLGQISYAYIDGTCQGWLPRGEVIVDVARGFEYEPLRTRVTIAPGQQELTLRLKRWSDLSRNGWYSGDTHVHFLSSQGGHFEAQGEDLNVVNLLLSQWGHLFTNTEEFTGEPSVSRDGRTIVYATQENRQHLLGHLTLLGLKQPVYPWCSDGPSEAELAGTIETTMADWADRCHAQGGTVILPHLPDPNGEPAALIATGRADAVEMINFNRYHQLEYYRYLNGGYRLPLVGGTDKMSSDVPVGLYRTYVRIPSEEEFTYASWCRNLTAGRTFLSGGPLLGLSVEGADIGDTLRLPKNGGPVEVRAWAESIFPISTLEIVQDGEVVASTENRHGTRRLDLVARRPVRRSGWLAVRTGGTQGDYYAAIRHRDCWARGILAHSSPIYVACGDEDRWGDPQVARYMLTLIEGSLTYLRNHSPQYQPWQVTHHHGEANHQAFLERPFLEAQQAIHRRLHELGLPH